MVDIIIALLLAAGAYLGYKRGLIMQIFYLGTIGIGIILVNKYVNLELNNIDTT